MPWCVAFVAASVSFVRRDLPDVGRARRSDLLVPIEGVSSRTFVLQRVGRETLVCFSCHPVACVLGDDEVERSFDGIGFGPYAENRAYRETVAWHG